MYAITFHHLLVGLSTGIATLACASALGAWISTYFVGGSKARGHLDKTAYIAGLAAIPLIFLSVLSGTSAMSSPGADAMSYNKFLFTGLTIGFLVSMLLGRWRFGPAIWLNSRLGLLQMVCAAGALGSITVLGSIGAKMSLGESTLDILPFWPSFDESIVVNQWFSIAMFVLGLGAMVAAFMLGPKTERLPE
ncbi:MAG: hypothetical protein CMA06_00170 [Euryarchaeota archaeon]|nr:hypothetical protein [Euryarchaeota archaeon]MDC0040911.1 hypothetical protein [Candidatus Poseidoniales archaeon]RCH71193.1 MAG: hypothetical protein DBX06_06410 [Candidatus Poseidoniales archaeon]RCH71547.1 MAG: hypothetical protein DBX06_05885 [Candidatus Poseidoniales archaeon]|tara:strand:+ start:3369 stop:3944 length:576 start_codon:yes stop_codon:yes gene_type:complete